MAVSATPTANRVAEPTHRLAISSRLLAPRPTSPRLPPQWVGRRPLRIWVKAEPNRMASRAVPLTTGQGQGPRWSGNGGDGEAYRPKLAKARKARQLVRMKANEASAAG